jgi:hypothetical protein
MMIIQLDRQAAKMLPASCFEIKAEGQLAAATAPLCTRRVIQGACLCVCLPLGLLYVGRSISPPDGRRTRSRWGKAHARFPRTS